MSVPTQTVINAPSGGQMEVGKAIAMEGNPCQYRARLKM